MRTQEARHEVDRWQTAREKREAPPIESAAGGTAKTICGDSTSLAENRLDENPRGAGSDRRQWRHRVDI